MSALTDLFSSYANKIRSKVGGSETYTPTEMVDAIDDVYDAGAASVSLQASKTVTATTSSQTVEPDTGYDGMEEVVVNPQAHTTTYTPATNTSANDMGANHEYRYVNTSGMIAPSGTKYITENGQSDVTNYATVDVNVSEIPSENLYPNNSLPDPIANGLAYQAMGNGYAIASYDSITPSSVGDFVSSGDIVKFGGNGVIFDSIPLPGLQIKNVTATTSALTVEPDSGYDGLLKVGIAPQPHTDTYFPNEDTAQNDMGVVHNYRYVNTSGMVTPSSITPSNSTPASLTSGSAVTPTANGYAIESYNTKTPSNSSPVALVSGEIDKIGGNGYAIESYSSITPTSIDGPEAMTADSIYKPTVNSYAIDSYTTVVSSDSTPPNLTVGNMYRVPSQGGAGGYFYKTQASSITPSNSSPATITSGSIYKASANGKAVASVTDVTPSSTPTSVSANDVVKIGGNGVIVDSIPTPTSLTPSNSTPATITSGETYTATANGKAVSSVTDITPSNSNPVSLSSGSIYKPSASGKAVASVTDITPTTIDGPVSMSANTVYRPTVGSYAINSYTPVASSDTNPPNLTQGNMYRISTSAGASGYLYKSSGLKNIVSYFNSASFTTDNSSSTNSVSVTNGKKYLLVAVRTTSSGTASNAGISSGATVDKTFVNNTLISGGRAKLYIVMCTATSSTITMNGTNNIVSVVPLN